MSLQSASIHVYQMYVRILGNGCCCLFPDWWMILLIVIWLVGTYVFVGFAPSIVSGRL